MDKELAIQPKSGGSIFQAGGNFGVAMEMARALAASDLVPPPYRGEKGVSNTLIAIDLANRVGMPPIQVMQNLHIIQGRPSWSSAFLSAMVERSERFEPLRYEMGGEGDDYGCYVWAYSKGTKDRVEGPKVTMGMAKAEGWVSKPGSKWKTMPELMLRYRAVAFFARLYAFDLICGLQTADEVVDANIVDIEKAPVAKLQAALLKESGTTVLEPEHEAEGGAEAEAEIMAGTPVNVEDEIAESMGIGQDEEPKEEDRKGESLPDEAVKAELWQFYSAEFNDRDKAVAVVMKITEGRGYSEWTNNDIFNLRYDVEQRKERSSKRKSGA